jgi:hypothetical protein
LLDEGVSLEKIAALLGHSNLNTTKIYTVPGQDDLERAVEKLEDRTENTKARENPGFCFGGGEEMSQALISSKMIPEVGQACLTLARQSAYG